ncbi:MAG: hypothetical protein QM780_08220 [Hyphomicrobium sp.]
MKAFLTFAIAAILTCFVAYSIFAAAPDAQGVDQSPSAWAEITGVAE